MEKSSIINRRKAIAGLGAGIASIAVSPAVGDVDVELEDPRDKYPKPPFKEQSSMD